ncbi:MAG: hypothetical protein E6J86_02110 [Deltaproteobacteria bacterium]|nr:MAG: hypothetical protein E6J86_02110 [Deltaproteobacteria bacterium]
MARSRCTVREPARSLARREQEGEIMLSSRTKQVLGCGIVMVAAVLGWTCAGGRSADHASFQREQQEMRRRLRGQVGDSGVNVEDDNVIIIGVLPSSYGKDNLTRIPSEMHVERGKSQKLTWVCWDGPFVLTFIDTLPDGGHQESPLEEMKTAIDARDSHSKSVPNVASAVVRSDAGAGRYEFSIHVDIVADGGSADDKRCPPIIID